uniref:Ring finger protein 141 n=1 Tax=Haplochromis burtoni TaxID=8153 RepID=A0A3Q2W155_HAPBU
MGQQISGQGVMNQLRQKLEKCLELLRDSRYLTYEEFLGRLAELNDITAEQQNDLLFEVQPGSDATAMWKVAVRVVCTKISKENGMVEASQIMNLYQFIKLYHDIASQSLQVPSAKSPSTELLADSCQASRSGSHDIKHTFYSTFSFGASGRACVIPSSHRFLCKCIQSL